jgi:tetratricopeptide (TPR) repeat protein
LQLSGSRGRRRAGPCLIASLTFIVAMPRILDVEAALLLLELDPPFDQRTVQLARRRMAKRWHPDIAPPGRRHEHQRHLAAINQAADELERLAEASRGGSVSRNAVKASAAATRRAREDAGRRAYENEQREREHDADRAKHDPFGSRVPDHSVVHRYARCVSYPEWGVGTVTGIYFSGDEEASQQWARVSFQVGVRTIPAGSLQFVDFSRPDPAADRVERFMTAAQHALAEGDAPLAAQRLVYARDAQPDNPAVLRLLTAAFWQAGNLPAAARTVRDWSRVETDRPTPERYASRIYEDMGAFDLAAEAAQKCAERAPADASAWERVGRLRLRLGDRGAAIAALERARLTGPSLEGLLDLALAYHLAGDVGAEVSAAAAATQIDPESPEAWSAFAHALARTDRISECQEACRRALAFGPDAEVEDLLARIAAALPRGLAAPSAAAARSAAA